MLAHFARTAALCALLALLAACPAAPTPGDASDAPRPPDTMTACEPECRAGFVCVRGACVSACNPPCSASEVCTADRTCAPVARDAGLDAALDAAPDALADTAPDTGSPDAPAPDAPAPDAPAPDAPLPGDGGPACPPDRMRCGGACVAPMLPDVGVRNPTRGTYGTSWFESGDLAVNPCTGEVALAYSQQLAGTPNWETYLVILPRSGTTFPAPIRVTTAPGKAANVEVVWTGDRYGVFWSDPRHDLNPETCTACLAELYFAAYSATGTLLVPERRLTNHGTSGAVSQVRAAVDPDTGTIGVAWADTRGGRQIYSALVAPDGTPRAEQQTSAAPSPRAGNTPRIVWDDDRFVLLYRHDEPDGSRPDYLHTRTLDRAGTLGVDRDLMVPAEQLDFTTRGALGFATISAGGSPLAMRLWTTGWAPMTNLPVRASTHDGSWQLAWDGEYLWLTDVGFPVFQLRRYNALGAEAGGIALTSDAGERAAANLRLERVGTRFVITWVHATTVAGSTVLHRVQVVDRASAM